MKASPLWSLWAWPVVIAILAGAGLVGGLAGDGRWDWMTWVGLGVPCVPACGSACAGGAGVRERGARARDAVTRVTCVTRASMRA